jgi:selenide, water dikinase
LRGLSIPSDENVLIGMATADDAGVYKISDDLALIQTVDFFTPIVDNPYDFGRIAAANALSDVYAMGGIPKTALNIVAFPIDTLDGAILRAILAGGLDTLREAQTVLLGGHSIVDQEMKYGLAITGFVHPGKILANQGLKTGDCLILTKALGTGIISTATKGGLVSDQTLRRVTELMATLNKYAAQIMGNFPVSACTDITGFGLLGHLAEMIIGTGMGVVIDSSAVPVLPDALEFAAMGMVPTAAYKNRLFRQGMVTMAADFDPVLRDILFDPQTSGGLLIGCAEQAAHTLLHRLLEEGVGDARIIGYVTHEKEERIYLTPR